jgi:hypothetical protein
MAAILGKRKLIPPPYFPYFSILLDSVRKRSTFSLIVTIKQLSSP